MGSVALTDSDFENEVLQSDVPVVLDFWAEWCAPCKAMGPIIDDIADEKQDNIKVFKMNIDENPDTPTKYGVRGIPTFMVFKDGQLLDTRVGGMTKAQLEEWVDGIL